MSRAWLPGMIAVVLLLGGCGGGKQTASPVDPTPDPTTPLPESNIPRGIGVDPPGGGPVVPPGPDPDALVILDVTINRTPLPANAWADLHAVSNVSLVSHAWHLGPNAVTRSYSTFASLPIKTLQPGLQRGWVEGWDAQGRHAMREFDLEVAYTPNAFIGVHLDKTEFAIGEEFEVDAIIEGPDPELRWTGVSNLFEYVVPLECCNQQNIRLRAVRPGTAQLGIENRDNYREPISYNTNVRVIGPPMLISQHQHDTRIGEAGKKGDMHWLSYGDADTYEWEFGSGATRLPSGMLNHYLQLHEAGLHTGQARAHNSYGWNEWQPFPYAIGRQWTQHGEWEGRPDRVFAVSQGRLWIAEASRVHLAPDILTIKSTGAALPLSAGVIWDEVTLSIPERASLEQSALDGCGRPVFVLHEDRARTLVAPATSDPQGADDWWMRSITLPAGFHFSQYVGSPQRLAMDVRPPHGPGPNSMLFDLPLGMLLSSSAPLDLINGNHSPALELETYEHPMVFAMPDGVGWIWGESMSSERQVAVNAGGTISEYTLTLPPADNGYEIGSAMANGRFFLTGITRQWSGNRYPAKVIPRVLMRTRTTLPLSASDWETLPYPEHLKYSIPEMESYPGSDRIWIGGLGVEADASATEFGDAAQWIPIVERAPGIWLHPDFAFGGRLYQLQVLNYGSHSHDQEVWSVSLE